METNLLWTGLDNYSLENCVVNSSPVGNEITSVIVCEHEGMIYRIDYRIVTNGDWETTSVEVSCRNGDELQQLHYTSDGQGNWSENDQALPEFKGCRDVDLPVTPFTNTLPVNRLQLKLIESQEISVIYMDLVARTIKPVRQKYTRIAANTYHYENVPNDFEADIVVDERGFVLDYPGLFVRTTNE